MDDPPPSSSADPDEEPGGRVIAFRARPRPAVEPSPAERARIEEVMRSALGSTRSANETAVEIDPEWSAMRADLEQQDLDARIIRAEQEKAQGEKGAAKRLRALRSLRAMRSYERGEERAAYQEWEALATEEPDDPEPLITRGHFFRRHNNTIAIEDYGRAALRSPADPEIYLARGRCFASEGEWERALPEYRRLVQLRPRDLDALDRLASALRFTDDHRAAIQVIGRAIALAPWRADFYAFRAACHGFLGALTEQLADLDRCLERDPKNAGALRSRASVHDRRNDEARALADLDRAIALDPTDAGTFQTRAYRHQKHGRLDLAVADFTRAIELKPESEVFRTARAELCLETGALDVALVDLDHVVSHRREIDADDCFDDDDPRGKRRRDRKRAAKALWLRGHVHRRRGDEARARADYEGALDLDEGLVRDTIQSEALNRKLDRKAEQRDDLGTLILLRPDDAEWRVARAELLADADDPAAALADLDAALALGADGAELFHARADLHFKLGAHDKAVADESEAVARAPREASYHALLGLYRAVADKPSAEAEASTLRALELDPDDLCVLFYRAWYLERDDRWEEAIAVYGRRIAVYPRMGILHFQRGVARVHVSNQTKDEAMRRAALADFDEAVARGYENPQLPELRAALLAVLDKEAAKRSPDADPAGSGSA